ncbi:caspase-8-like [Haliotis rubra]|uniref:caspase-8-like n=1 Tax=Haliotis rubra TaxID=36100 RepID=UPI001EE56A08|nr:caspase-8-like [Haliotis rubra]XP_046556041.1 caspase-8-like [Haliotis rubra]XP_046556042.1 caspase-8-like [Haliotis rubra]XP_046556043.1 caspase-8-like [Haliotis rubra]XP_046556044.1 caspase-8-like [Haliotis rubra]XP_046556045.1 caspase-8-like [Haliotis rubra]XP_046556046.1 caspase-8-like [Haliotis rubra]
MHEDTSYDGQELAFDAEDEGPDYRRVGLHIGEDLHDDDLDALKFISRDYVAGGKLDRITTATELLTQWEKVGKFGKDNPWYLAECLLKIQRIDLLEEELGFDESVIDKRLEQGQSQISQYRNMLLEVAEDLDSEELQKMMYLIGDMKKKDKGKIVNPMSLITYLEQTKQITQDNLHKLKQLLGTIDRNDLQEVISKFEGTKGLPNSAANVEEGMDTSEPYVPPQHLAQPSQLPPNTKNSRSTVAERPPAVVNRIPATENEQLRGVGHETRGVTVTLPGSSVGAAAAAATAKYPLATSTQQVFSQDQLQDIVHQLAHEFKQESWMVFGYQLGVGPDIVHQLSQVYPDMTQRIHHLLTLWLQKWQGGCDAAMEAIIQALHEVQIHNLADQFSRIYSPPEEGFQDISLASRPQRTSLHNHANISVNTSEARYREPEQDPPQPAAPPAVASSSHTQEAPDRIMPFYRMDRKPRGICIIINNEVFHKDPEDRGAREMPNREGTHVDATNLLKTFTELYFDVRQYDNMKSTDMVRVLVNMALNVDHKEYDCFACCILSHGAQGHIYGTDGRLVSITDMTGPFKSVVCPSLAGKPKLFFIQACQGREKQEGQEIQRDSAEVEEDGIPREVIPNEADFLIGYATVPGFVSYRSRSHGSWYITKLAEMLNKYGTKYDILSVLLLVNNEVGRANAMMDGGRYKQSPAPLYTLRKKVLFK